MVLCRIPEFLAVNPSPVSAQVIRVSNTTDPCTSSLDTMGITGLSLPHVELWPPEAWLIASSKLIGLLQHRISITTQGLIWVTFSYFLAFHVLETPFFSFWKQGAKKWFIIYITNFLLKTYFFEAHPILRHTLLQCWARSDFHRYNFPQRKWCGNQSDWMWRGWSQLVILRVLWHCLTMEFFKWHPLSSNLSGLIHL